MKAFDLWNQGVPRAFLVITTNQIVKQNGEAVMGAGLALEAKRRYPGIATWYGSMLSGAAKKGRRPAPVWCYSEARFWMFPTKWDWRDPSDPELIRSSALSLVDRIYRNRGVGVDWPTFLPRVGCKNGGLSWAEVEPLVAPLLVLPEIVLLDEDGNLPDGFLLQEG